MTSAAGRRRATIAMLPGDGIGPEVVAAARLVLEAVAARFGHDFEFEEALIGGVAIDVTGTALPAETIALCERVGAVLLGAVGGKKWDDPLAAVRPEQGLLGLRRELGLFANIRPVAPHPSLADASPLKAERLTGVDLVVVRELTGGIYFGAQPLERTEDGERASDVCSYTEREIENVTRVAAELARARRQKLTSVDKANVLETSRLWRRVVTRVVAEDYPGIELDHMLIDTCAMRLIQRPAEFDVILTENMFGDILTDEAAVLAGSIGVLPSASLGAATSGLRRGLYEPIHGSAPDIAGRGVANPIGAILSAALLLRYSLGLETEAEVVELATHATIAGGRVTPDLITNSNGAATTAAVADEIAARVADGTVPRLASRDLTSTADAPHFGNMLSSRPA